MISEGQATYILGDATLEVSTGQIVLVEAFTPHKFINSGEGILRQMSVHASPQMITDWLED